MKCMISIGHFGQPSAVALQVAAIRANCGDIPIMVSDDYTETYSENGPRLKQQLIDLCRKESLILVNSGSEKLGHAGGDLGSMYHGINWAAANDCQWVWKLSQRFVVDIPDWANKVLKQIDKLSTTNYHITTICRQCAYGTRPMFTFRTECIGFRVETWRNPSLLEQLVPRELFNAAENIVANAFISHSKGAAFYAPTWLVPDRTQKVKDIYWKENPGSLKEYQELAKKYRVSLGQDFHTESWFHKPNYKAG